MSNLRNRHKEARKLTPEASVDPFSSLNLDEIKLYQTHMAPVLNSILGDFLQFAPKNYEIPYDEIETMLATSPIVAVALEVKSLLTLSALGKYRSSDPRIQQYVEQNENGLKSSRFKSMIAKSLIKNFIGWSAHELSYRQGNDGFWYLNEAVYLTPRLCRFRGYHGQVSEIYYNTKFGYKQIPINRIFHLSNQDFLDITSSPYGLASSRRMLALWKSFQVVMSSLMIACPKQAFPFLVGYADTNKLVQLFDENGQPIVDEATGKYKQQSAAKQMSLSMKGIENTSAVVVDKANKIEAIAQQADGKILFTTINLLIRLILLTVLIPSIPLMQSEGGSGDSNLGRVQLEFMYELAANDMENVAMQIVDQIHKPLIIANFGEQDDYGHYEINRSLNSTVEKIFSLIGDLTQKGVLAGQNVELGTQILKDLGLPHETLGTLGNIT